MVAASDLRQIGRMQEVTAIVLSGGGAGGVYLTAGLAERARQGEVDYPEIVVGTSAGALVATWIAAKKRTSLSSALDELTAMFIETRRRDVWRFRWGFISDLAKGLMPGFLRRWFEPPTYGVFHQRPLRQILERLVGPADVAQSWIKLGLVAVGLNSGKVKVFSEADDIYAANLASTAFPVLAQPEKIGCELYLDGGMREITPWRAAYDLWKAHHPGTRLRLVVVSTVAEKSAWTARRSWGLFEYFGRMLGITVAEVAESDLQFSRDPNVRVELLQPEYGLPASAMDFSRESVTESAVQGAADSASRWRVVQDWEQ